MLVQAAAAGLGAAIGRSRLIAEELQRRTLGKCPKGEEQQVGYPRASSSSISPRRGIESCTPGRVTARAPAAAAKVAQAPALGLGDDEGAVEGVPRESLGAGDQPQCLDAAENENAGGCGWG